MYNSIFHETWQSDPKSSIKSKKQRFAQIFYIIRIRWVNLPCQEFKIIMVIRKVWVIIKGKINKPSVQSKGLRRISTLMKMLICDRCCI